MAQFDVWKCYVNGRISYRATMFVEDTAQESLENPDRPDWATSHLDTVEAPNKKTAIKIAVQNNRGYS